MASGVENIGGLIRVERYLRNLAKLDMKPLATKIEKIVISENQRRLLSGLDSNDAAMKPTKREQNPNLSRRLGGGPPLIPNRKASRAIQLFRVVDRTFHSGGFVIVFSWPGFTSSNGKSILGFHKNGSGPYPVRDITRVSPSTKQLIQKTANEYVTKALRYSTSVDIAYFT